MLKYLFLSVLLLINSLSLIKDCDLLLFCNENTSVVQSSEQLIVSSKLSEKKIKSDKMFSYSPSTKKELDHCECFMSCSKFFIEINASISLKDYFPSIHSFRYSPSMYKSNFLELDKPPLISLS